MHFAQRVAFIVVCLIACNFCQAQSTADFLNDRAVQQINLTVDPDDWATLKANYLDSTYYAASFAWNGLTAAKIGIRSHGGGSRSPVKPNLDVNFAHYDKTATFLNLPFVILKANNEDPSNLHEWLSMKLFRRMGMLAGREAPAQLYVNGELVGFYFIVEHLDETFLQRNFGESGGYLYEWENIGDNYDFEDLGSDPSLYANYLDLKTDQDTPDLQTFANLIQAINAPPAPETSDGMFIKNLSQYIDPKLFLTYAAIENTLAEADGAVGGLEGANNFYLYQFQGTTLYQMIPWDKDLTFSDPNRDIMDGFENGPYINVLAQRLAGIYDYKQTYLKMLWKAATLLGETGGWADQEITREYGVIHDAAVNDPNKQCLVLGVLEVCGTDDFENGVQYVHDFLSQRAGFVRFQATYEGYQPSADDPQIADGGISALSGEAQIWPGVLASASGSNLGRETLTGTTPWPRILGDTFIAVDGVRAPLASVASDQIQFQIPSDIAPGHISVVVSVNGAMSNTADAVVTAQTDGSAPASFVRR